MRIIIYGAGAIGNAIGSHLARSAQEVVLIGRPAHIEAVNQNGLKFKTPKNTCIVNIPSFTSPAEITFRKDDVVFLCVKGQNTREALGDLKRSITEIPLFCFQNGIRNEEIASKTFKEIYAVQVTVGASFLRNGEVDCKYDAPGLLIMGKYPAGTDDLLESVAGMLRNAGFIVITTPDPMLYKWGKLIDNLANAVDAITSARRNEIKDIISAARIEAEDLMRKAGIKWKSQRELLKEYATLFPSEAFPKFEGSTWQSLTRRQGTVEADFLNGEIVRLAKKLGLRAPINEKLQIIVEEMAKNGDIPGKYSPSQLKQMLGI